MEKSRYNKIISQFHKKTVLVVGDLKLDKYLWGRTNRISPEAPVPIVDVRNIDYRPGGAANVALKFHNSIGITGTILTRIDGDSRGGAALSIKTIPN